MIYYSEFQKGCQRLQRIAAKNFMDLALAIFVLHPFEVAYQDM